MAGDGGLAMLMGELLTVTQYDLPIKIVVFNNSALGMVKLEMEVDRNTRLSDGFEEPEFCEAG